jgi:hypothetical protein
MVMIGVFSFTVGSRVRGWFCKRPITIKVWQRDVNWFAKVYKFLPIAAAGMAALAISFISILVVGFGQFVVPGWILIIPAWCLVIAGSLFAWLKTSPTVLLEVDEYHRRLTVRTSSAGDRTSSARCRATASESRGIKMRPTGRWTARRRLPFGSRLTTLMLKMAA